MVNIKIVLAFVLVVPFALTQAKIFSMCELAREMARLGIPKWELPDWVCIARYESNYNTKATNVNTDHSKDWGIFQINDRYWCKPNDGRPTANVCNVACTSLLDDNIQQAVSCGVKIKKIQGWKAWVAWRHRCQSDKPNTDQCF